MMDVLSCSLRALSALTLCSLCLLRSLSPLALELFFLSFSLWSDSSRAPMSYPQERIHSFRDFFFFFLMSSALLNRRILKG